MSHDFIKSDCKVKVVIVYRGREIVHQELGRDLMDRLTEDLKEIADVESPARMEGRNLTCTFIPNRKAKANKE